MRFPFLVLTILSICAFDLPPRAARADGPGVSDSDRATARELYRQGTALQQEGKYAAALEKFQTAQRIFSAPTHLLYIAECQAALGKLVEATETYRSLVQMTLPPDASPAFLAAKQQAEAELPQVAPRIPTLRIEIKPANAPELSVTIDREPLNLAFIGVNRLINPGEHKIAVKAKGYNDTEYLVTVREREAATAPIKLHPKVEEAVAQAATPPATPAPIPPPYVAGGAEPPPVTVAEPPPPRYVTEIIERPRRSSFSFLFGPQVGLLIPAAGTTATGQSLTDLSSAGASVGADVGIRFAHYFYTGVGFDFAFFSTPSSISGLAQKGQLVSVSSRSGNVMGTLGVISHAHGIGFFGEGGIGYRWYFYDVSLPLTSPTPDARVTNEGPEFVLGAGLYIKAGPWFRLVPKIQLGVGSFTDSTTTCESGDCSQLAAATGSVGSSSAFTFVRLGLGGYFNFDG